jgi:hypothetical protein
MLPGDEVSAKGKKEGKKRTLTDSTHAKFL